MMKKLSVILVICLLCSGVIVNAEQGEQSSNIPYDGILDDCVDFSKVHDYSGDGLCAIESTGDDRSVFQEDFTFFQRVTNEAEWVIYEIPQERFLSVQTYFWQGEALEHFSFFWSTDGTDWQRATPTVKTEMVGSDKWLPVSYEFKKLSQTAKYLKISFPAQNSVAWSPVMSSVTLHSFSSGDGGFSDTSDTPYHEAITVLKNLGFVNGITENEFRPNDSITRAEFCALIARVLNLDKQGIFEEQPIFSDVMTEHWGRSSIETLYRLGIVNGTSADIFCPDENVRFSQAIKILVSVLGFAPEAELEGGYPVGYLSIAKQLHLIDKISASERQISRGEAAMYLYRAADTECMERIVYGNKEKYNKHSQTLLKKYHNIEKLKAIITDVGSASITGGSVLDEKYFVAGGVQYNCGRMDMEEFLGQRTTFYIQTEDDTDNLTALYAFSDANCYTDIEYPEFEKLDGSRICYVKNDKEKKITVNSDTRIVYNGRYLSRIGLEKELPFQSGKLRLIDNDNDGIAEILLITDYQTYYLAADAKIGSVLSDLYLGAVSTELENVQHIVLTRYDEKVEYNRELTVSAGDVVQIARSQDGVRAQVIILNDYTAGIIEQYSEKEQTCDIAGISYKLSDYFIKSGQVPELNAKEVFAYLDSNGAIVAMTYVQGLDYAYLQSVSLNGAFDTEGKIRLVRESGKSELVPVTTKTKLNGKKLRENEFAQMLNSLQPQLIQIRVYPDGSAADIQTANENTANVPLKQEFSCDYRTEGSIYRAGNFTLFDSVYQLTNATKVFVIPREPTKIEQYYVGGTSLLQADLKYKTELYDLNTQYQAAVAVVYQDGSEERNIAAYDVVMVVEECSTYLNDENEYAIKLNGWVGGEQTELLFRSDGAEDQTGNWLPYSTNKTTVASGKNSFAAGDVIQFVKDYSGYCDKFRVLFDASQCSEEYFYEQNARDYGGISRTNYYSELYSGYGSIEHLFSNKLFYRTNIVENWIRTVVTTNARVYLLDSKKGKIQTAELTDLEIGNRIFVRMNFTNCNEIIIVQ